MTTNNDTVDIAIVGAGWRSDFFLRVADAMPSINVCGVVARRETRADDVRAQWAVPCYRSVSELLDGARPQFAIASVSAEAMPGICLELAERHVPILAETPPAPSLSRLIEVYQKLTKLKARIQVAEQYWAQPLHAARQGVVDSGLLGNVSHVHISVCHGYHAISLIRRLLGVRYERATIHGQRFISRVIAGPDRAGPPTEEKLVDVATDFAWLDFGDRLGQYEFGLPQYRSWIRGQRVCVRGERGEIVDDRVTFLKDEVTPIVAPLVRHDAGRNGNLEGFHLKGIQLLDDWVYLNSTLPARLSDEEIAVAQCLLDMRRYVEDDVPFYSLEEACQDQYLALACAQAIETGELVTTEEQTWSGQT